MAQGIAHFADTEQGAVTVDWVVLAAAVIMLGVGALQTIHNGTLNVSTALSEALSDATVTLDLD